MSYGVYIGGFSANYTSNLARMFHEHIRVGDTTGLSGAYGLWARPKLTPE